MDDTRRTMRDSASESESEIWLRSTVSEESEESSDSDCRLCVCGGFYKAEACGASVKWMHMRRAGRGGVR